VSEGCFLNCCPINEQTADGVRVGRCWHTLRDGRCPIHGDVRKAVELIQAEQSLWIVTEILKQEANTDHGFTKQIRALMKQASQLAGEIREYNDQFERAGLNELEGR
jgi:hypothetical protein